MREYIIRLTFLPYMIWVFYVFLGLIYKIQKVHSERKKKEIATLSNLKDFSYLKREFLTTTLVINLQQANEKQWKMKSQGENGVEVWLGFRQWVRALMRQAAGSGSCTFITAAPTWPPVAASEEADNPHTLSSCILAATKCAHIIGQRIKLYQKHQCDGGKSSTRDE